MINGAHAMAANRVSFFYDLRGPSLVIDTACSSSTVARNMACRDLKDGVSEVAAEG